MKMHAITWFKKRYLTIFFGAIGISILIFGCSEKIPTDPISNNGENTINQSSGYSEKIEDLTEADAPYLEQIKEWGYSTINVQKKGDWFIIDDDIYFHRNDLKNTISLKKTTQRSLGNTVNQNLVGNIRVRIDASIAGWSTFINSALNNWNNVPETMLHFQIVTTNPQITIYSDNAATNPLGSLSANTCGATWGPSDGNPGSAVAINMDNTTLTSSDARKIRTITHEFGHTVGIAHTNDPRYALIIGTPSTDNVSLMNGGECDIGALQLSSNDMLAIRILYPLPAPSIIDPNKWYRISSYASTQYANPNNYTYCLNVNNIPNIADGSNVQVWSYGGGQSNELWRFVRNPDGSYRLQSQYNTIFDLNVNIYPPVQNGSNVQVWSEAPDHTEQNWFLDPAPDNCFYIRSAMNISQYLNVNNEPYVNGLPVINNGSNVQVWTWGGGQPNEKWVITPIP